MDTKSILISVEHLRITAKNVPVNSHTKTSFLIWWKQTRRTENFSWPLQRDPCQPQPPSNTQQHLLLFWKWVSSTCLDQPNPPLCSCTGLSRREAQLCTSLSAPAQHRSTLRTPNSFSAASPLPLCHCVVEGARHIPEGAQTNPRRLRVSLTTFLLLPYSCIASEPCKEAPKIPRHRCELQHLPT